MRLCKHLVNTFSESDTLFSDGKPRLVLDDRGDKELGWPDECEMVRSICQFAEVDFHFPIDKPYSTANNFTTHSKQASYGLGGGFVLPFDVNNS
jgi:hypothetical protein